ncbi:hypothetical protein [Chryseobacterium gregarium]|uniref:hypothetical protein n=1 Tax=Chryseobacterium gregarium TaxID=456299 RepID=UPI00041D02B6|nr:hypothetical protein [Chryseobacterium gregarium]
MVKRIILFVLLYALFITIVTLTLSQAGDIYFIVIAVSGPLLGLVILREIYKKYYVPLPLNQNVKYSHLSSEGLQKISGRPFLLGLEKKVVSADDFYFDQEYFYAVNKNNQTAKFSLKDIKELSKTAYQINNSRIWQVKINDQGEEVVFNFAHNYSIWNKNFLTFYHKLKEVNPSVIQSKWSVWSM